MTPEQEIDRIKKDFAEDWKRFEQLPEIQKALAEKNPTKLAEIANAKAYGDFGTRNSASRRLVSALRKFR